MKSIVFFSLIGLFISGCSGFFLGEPNLAEPTNLPQNPNQVTIERQWRHKIGKGTDESALKLRPFVNEDTVYVVSADGRLEAISLEQGDVLWEKRLGHPISAGVAGDNQRLIVGTKDGLLMALSADDGELLWSFQLSTEIIALPTVVGDRVIARTIDGQVTALTLDRGQSLWRQDIGVADLTIRGNADALLLGDVILLTNGRGVVSVLSIADGQPVLTAPVVMGRGLTEVQRIADLLSTPTFVNGVLYVSAYRYKTLAIDLQNGGLVWEKPQASALDLFADEQHVYLIDKNSLVSALSLQNGDVVWENKTLEGRQLSPLSGDGRYLYLVDLDGNFVVLSASSGELLGYQRLASSRAHIAPIRVSENGWLIYTRDGFLTHLTIEGR